MHPLGLVTTIRNGSVATRARYQREQQTPATALIGLLSRIPEAAPTPAHLPLPHMSSNSNSDPSDFHRM